MPIFFRMGKQRYCQGLPLLLSMTAVPGDMNDLPDGIVLEPLEEGMPSARRYEPTGVFLNDRCPTAAFALDSNEIAEGTYNLVALDRSAISRPVMILTRETYAKLLGEENAENFDEDLIPVSDVYRFVESIVSEYWTRVESIQSLLIDRVMRSGFHPTLAVTGQVETERTQVSIAKVRYGSEAILSDLSYLAAAPVGDEVRSEQSAFDFRVDQRGNLLLYARTQVGVTRPDRFLSALESYSDIKQLQHFHPGVFKLRIALSRVNIFELSLTITAESEKGSQTKQAEDPPVSAAGGSAVAQTEYATS